MVTNKDLENYKWDTSGYVQFSPSEGTEKFPGKKWDTSKHVLIHTGVRRDWKTGRLMRINDSKTASC